MMVEFLKRIIIIHWRGNKFDKFDFLISTITFHTITTSTVIEVAVVVSIDSVSIVISSPAVVSFISRSSPGSWHFSEFESPSLNNYSICLLCKWTDYNTKIYNRVSE